MLRKYPDHGQHRVADGLGEGLVGGASRGGAQPGDELGGGTTTGVGMPDAERGHLLSHGHGQREFHCA